MNKAIVRVLIISILVLLLAGISSASVVDFSGFEAGKAFISDYRGPCQSECTGFLSGNAIYPMIQSGIKYTGNFALHTRAWGSQYNYFIMSKNKEVYSYYNNELCEDFTCYGDYNVETLYTRFYFRCDELPSSGSELIFSVENQYEDYDDEYNPRQRLKFELAIDYNGDLLAFDKNSSQLGNTMATELEEGVWYRIEVKVGTGSSAAWEVKVDGSSAGSGTGNLCAPNDLDQYDITNGRASIVKFGKTSNCNSQSVSYYYDDICLDDSGYPGSGQTVQLRPNADGTDTGWAASSGDKWACVDDPPCGYTGYSLGDYISYYGPDPYSANLQDRSTIGLDQFPGSVMAVKPYSVGFWSYDPSMYNLRIRYENNLYEWQDPVTIGNVNTLGYRVGADGSAWTNSEIDSLQAGIKWYYPSVPPQATAMGAMLEFKNDSIPFDESKTEALDFYPNAVNRKEIDCSINDYHIWNTDPYIGTYRTDKNADVACASPNGIGDYTYGRDPNDIYWDNVNSVSVGSWVWDTNYKVGDWFRINVPEGTGGIPEDAVVTGCTVMVVGFGEQAWFGNERSDYDICVYNGPTGGSDIWVYDIASLDSIMDGSRNVYVGVNGPIGYHDNYIDQYSHAVTDYVCLRVNYYIPEAISDVLLWTSNASPQYAYTNITLTGIATDGTAPEYRFEVYDSTPSLVAYRDYSSTYNWDWMPTVAGTYSLKVLARESGTQSPVYDDTITNYVIQTPPNPTVTITSPTSNPTCSTSVNTIDIGGTASVYSGLTFSSVTWSNNRGGSGSCTGTTSWSKTGITLQSGENVITVTVTDSLNHTGTDVLTVTYTPTNPVTYISSSSTAFEGSWDWMPSSLTANKPANIQAGDLLIAITAGNGTPQTPSGWTQVESQNKMGVFYKYATGSEPSTYTFSWSGGYTQQLGILAYRYTATSSPIDCDDYNTGLTTDSLNMSQAGMLLTAFINPTSNPSGMTQRLAITSVWDDNNDEEQSSTVKIYDEVRTSSGATGTRSAGTNPYQWAYILAIKGQ